VRVLPTRVPVSVLEATGLEATGLCDAVLASR
jgi:hypothetical protein